ncbi:hypothetical protein [Saliterribacillus persicus]|uniref:Uncharacterized protein n=1 Tax=Saliterribacillus persicus TaxID=930114 RepID=A0A368X7W4_9BACI|nr:hypothetical protein [Saliterribacillus persicus]RCW63905.1 hypothetical protein DFR57_11530 [Saliterribacillus persicus]
MHFDQKLKDLLTEASLYGLLAKKYEYTDPQRHMYFYQKYFDIVQKIEKHYMMHQGNKSSHHMMPGQYPMY